MFSGKFTDHTLLPYSSPNYTTSQDRDLIIHFWGTLYNHQALGFKNTDSNATVVHKLFLKQGITHFNELDGAFTFIIFLSKQTIMDVVLKYIIINMILHPPYYYYKK